jgi:cytochrome c biogenesis protein
MIGLTVSLFVRRRRVWVKCSASDDGSTLVQVAGLAKSEAGDVSADTQAIWDAVEGREGKGRL